MDWSRDEGERGLSEDSEVLSEQPMALLMENGSCALGSRTLVRLTHTPYGWGS